MEWDLGFRQDNWKTKQMRFTFHVILSLLKRMTVAFPFFLVAETTNQSIVCINFLELFSHDKKHNSFIC
jgi:hypothetical protein